MCDVSKGWWWWGGGGRLQRNEHMTCLVDIIDMRVIGKDIAIHRFSTGFKLDLAFL